MKKKLLAGVALLGALAMVTTGCGSSSAAAAAPAPDGGRRQRARSQGIKVGFAQTGSESGWRSANTESMKKAFSKENGFDLIFNAADNDPAAQIAAVRSFISQGVDAIVIAPIVSDGWDDVLKEAKNAKIPVVLEDRTTSSPDDLFASWVGDDFKKEGETAGKWAAEQYGSTADQDGGARGHDRLGPGQRPGGRLRRRHQGHARSRRSPRRPATSPATVARRSWRASCRSTASRASTWCSRTTTTWRSARSRRSRRRAASRARTSRSSRSTAVHDGMQALVDGKINYIVECNPLLGDQAADLVKKVLAGTAVEKKNFAHDGAFTQERRRQCIATRAVLILTLCQC